MTFQTTGHLYVSPDKAEAGLHEMAQVWCSSDEQETSQNSYPLPKKTEQNLVR